MAGMAQKLNLRLYLVFKIAKIQIRAGCLTEKAKIFYNKYVFKRRGKLRGNLRYGAETR